MRLTTPSRLHSLALILIALATTLSGASPDDTPSLKLTAEIINLRYCTEYDHTLDITFKLQLRVENQSNKKLIVERTPGLGYYSMVIARDEKSLSERKYEYSPNTEEAIDHFPDETPEQFKSPGPEFAILAPGDSLQAQKELHAEGLSVGSHLLKAKFSTWDFWTKPQEIRKQWESFGYLVYEDISTGAVPFNLPTASQIGKCQQ